jgi:hypothetical protein
MDNSSGVADRKPEIRVFVGGLAPEWDDEVFCSVMSYFGTVLSAQIKRYPGGLSKRFGFAVLTNVKDYKNLYGHHVIDGGKEIEIQEHKKQNSVFLSYSPDSGLTDREIASWFESEGLSITSIDHHYRRGQNGYPRATFEDESCVLKLLHKGFVYIRNVRIDILGRSVDRKSGYRAPQSPGYAYSNPYYHEQNSMYYDQDQYFDQQNLGQYNQPSSNYKTQDPPRSSNEDEQYYFANKLTSQSAHRKNQPQGRNQATKISPPQNPLNPTESDYSLFENEAIQPSKWSSRQELSGSEKPNGIYDLKSPQAAKLGDSETYPHSSAIKKVPGSKKESVQNEFPKKSPVSSHTMASSSPEMRVEKPLINPEQSQTRAPKSGNRPEFELPNQAPAGFGMGSSLKTPSNRGRGQLNSKNTSDFYPNGSPGKHSSVQEASSYDTSITKPIPWLPQTPVVSVNNLHMWPQAGEFIHPEVANAQRLGLMMSPYVYSTPANVQAFPPTILFEESHTPVEPAKRREWSISYYAFPGLV